MQVSRSCEESLEQTSIHSLFVPSFRRSTPKSGVERLSGTFRLRSASRSAGEQALARVCGVSFRNRSALKTDRNVPPIVPLFEDSKRQSICVFLPLGGELPLAPSVAICQAQAFKSLESAVGFGLERLAGGIE